MNLLTGQDFQPFW